MNRRHFFRGLLATTAIATVVPSVLSHIPDGADILGPSFETYTSHFKWDATAAVQDWRYVTRVANIDCSSVKRVLYAA